MGKEGAQSHPAAAQNALTTLLEISGSGQQRARLSFVVPDGQAGVNSIHPPPVTRRCLTLQQNTAGRELLQIFISVY